MKQEQSKESLVKRGSESDLSKASLPPRFIARALELAGEGMLKIARFSGLVIDTNVADMQQGLSEGGALSVRYLTRDYRGEQNVPLHHIENASISCVYRVSSATNSGRDELRETIDMIRKDMLGGVILNFTDGHLIGGITNAVRRVYFDPEEQGIAERLLLCVREVVNKRR